MPSGDAVSPQIIFEYRRYVMKTLCELTKRVANIRRTP